MKRHAVLLAIAGIVGNCALAHAAEQPKVPLIKFKAEMPLQLPEGTYFGEVPGVTVNKQGHVFVFTRSDLSGPAYGARATQLLEFDQNGKYIREIGRNLYGWGYPHQLRFDKDDNLWAVDKGTNVIVKFDKDGHVADVYGRPEEATEFRSLPTRDHPHDTRAPKHLPGIFNMQTDIAWDSKGNAYVTDGYGNSRVVKISPNGFWLKTWGERGTGPSQFLEPHDLVIDNKDNIYVNDRGNARIQVFNTDGKFLRQFTLMRQVPAVPGGEPPTDAIDPNVPRAFPDVQPWGRGNAGIVGVTGAPMSICITPGANQVIYIADMVPSRIYKVSLEGKVLGMFADGGTKLGELNTTHQLACPDDHTIWAADMFNWRVQKFTLLE